MITKNYIKWVQSLKYKKYRMKNGLFLAEGPKIIHELIASNYKIYSILATHEGRRHLGEVPSEKTYLVNPQQLKQMSQMDTPQAVLAIVEIPDHQAINLQQMEDWILAIDGLQNPGNLGTIIRTADWFGITQIVCSSDTVEAYNPKVVQGSMGSLFHLSIHYRDLITFLPELDMPVFTLEMEGQNLLEFHFPKKGVLITGNEAKGPRNDLKPYVTDSLTIPRFGKAESLNAGMATAIGLSQIRCQ